MTHLYYRPSPNEAMEALVKLAEKMIGLFNSEPDYCWGGEQDSENDWWHLYPLFEYATGFDLNDEENPKFDEFRKWGLKATEAEIVAEVVRLAKQIRKD